MKQSQDKSQSPHPGPNFNCIDIVFRNLFSQRHLSRLIGDMVQKNHKKTQWWEV